MNASRPRVLMLTTQLGYGGAETSFIRLANALQASADVTVALFTRHYGAGGYAQGHEALNVPVLLLDGDAPVGCLRRWWRRIRALRALKAQHDVAISFLSGPNLVNALAGHCSRTVVSLRGSRRYDPVAPRCQRRLFQYLLDPLLYGLSARIVPVSAGLSQEVPNAWRTKMRVIPPFIDPAALAQKRLQPPPAHYDVLRGQPVVVAVGRMSVEKGFSHLIRVFARVSRAVPGAKLLLVGDGPMLAALRQQCLDLSLPLDVLIPGTSSVLFAGYQPHVVPLMALGRVLALPSATEGFPSVLLEAMAAGVPVIAADTPWGARAILHARDTSDDGPYPTHAPQQASYGTLMPRIDDPAHEQVWASALVQHFVQAPGNGAAAIARVEDFAREKVVAQWLRLIEELR